jgi:hypothetical protein
MRKWGIGIWLLIGLVAIGAGSIGAWYFRRRVQYGFSQLLGIGISGTTLAFFGTIRKETMRWQDNRIRRIDNTDKIIDFYNHEVREPVSIFLKQFKLVIGNQKKRSRWKLASVKEKQDFYDLTESRLGLAKILHLIDKIAWLLDQNGYLERQAILSAIGSETARLLINDEFDPIIQRMLADSSLVHIQNLITTLKGDKAK